MSDYLNDKHSEWIFELIIGKPGNDYGLSEEDPGAWHSQ